MIEENLNSRGKVKRMLDTGQAKEILRGELIIDDKVIQKALDCVHVGFAERKHFADILEIDVVTVAPYAVIEDKGNVDFDADHYRFPDLRKWVTQTGRFTFAILDGAFERGIYAQGIEAFFSTLGTSPVMLQEWIQAVEKLNLDLVQRLAVEGVDGIILADDVAYAGGLMVNPKSLRDYFIPSLARQVEKIKYYGLPVFYHSDGNYRMVLGDILQAGFDGLHCIDRNSGMDISALQQEVGERICLWGHLDVRDLEEVVQDREVLAKKAQSIKELAFGHRFLLGTSSGLFEGVNIKGLKALYQRVNC